MNLDTFFEKFDLFADAPNAVAKMRELILWLAVRGKLTKQELGEESGQELIARIWLDLARRKNFTKPSDCAIDTDEGLPSLPVSWTWARFCEIAMIASNLVNPNEYLDSIHLAPDNIEKGTGKLLPCRTIREDEVKSSKHRFYSGQIVYSKIRPNLAKVVIVNFDGLCSADMYPVDSLIDAKFLQVFMLSDIFLAQSVKNDTRVAMPKINQTELNAICVSVPPLAEQKRIVAKVDELMALCDRLEAQQQQRETRHTALAQASLTRFADAPTPANLEFLFHRSYSASPVELRKSILSLALRGKLVPQDPNDKPEGFTVTSRGGLKSVSSKAGADGPFHLPVNWQWLRLGQVCELINGDRSKNYPNKAEYVQDGVAWINTGHIEPDGTLSIDTMHYISRQKFDSLRSGKVRPGDLVYCLRGATLGKTAIITQFQEGAVASSLVIIRLSTQVDPRFVYRFLTSPLGREQIYQFDNGSAQPNLSANNVKKYWIPTPPLPEQKRIVAKVEQLMGLVDRLEAQLAESRATATALLDAVVAELSAAA